MQKFVALSQQIVAPLNGNVLIDSRTIQHPADLTESLRALPPEATNSWQSGTVAMENVMLVDAHTNVSALFLSKLLLLRHLWRNPDRD